MCYHAMNRGNQRGTIYHDEHDYRAFEDLMRLANERLPMRILAWCLMPNHFHVVLWPYEDGDLGHWMHWLLTTHVQRHRRRHGTDGRIWRGRFKAVPVQQDDHLFVVMRYVERNPLAANLVARAHEWSWSSLRARMPGAGAAARALLSTSPTPIPADWFDLVEQALAAKELEDLQTGLRRARPYGDAAWTRGTAERLGLLESLQPRGRPRSWRPLEEL
jgi:putative transposase